MKFGSPVLLWALLVLPLLVIAYAIDGQRRRRLLDKLGHSPTITVMVNSISNTKRRWKAVLNILGIACLLLAIARPQLPGRARLTTMRGLDLVIALDFSRSMLAKDVYPSRLARAKAELGRFIDNLQGDRVGLVAFAGETLSYPLTVDYEAAKLFWRDFTPDDMPVGGTDLGRAISASADLLSRVREKDTKNKAAQVILLITDGEDTEGQGLAAAKRAAALGIKIFPVGIGSASPQYVQLYDENDRPSGFLTDNAGKAVRVGLDENGLRQIAHVSGGQYIASGADEVAMDRVKAALATLERSVEDSRLEREPEDIARFFFAPAFVLLLISAWTPDRKRRATTVYTEHATSPARAALLLLIFLPVISGFDFVKRRDPNVEAGNKALAAGDAKSALESYDKAATALPDDPIIQYDRGAALYSLGQFPEAQKSFQRATESREPQVKADAFYNLGNAQAKQEHWKEALEGYRRALTLRPDDPRAKLNLELALEKLKQKQQQQSQQDQKKQDDKKDDKNKDDKKEQQASEDQKPNKDDKKDGQDKKDDQDKKNGDEKSAEQKAADEKKSQEQEKQAGQDQKPKPEDGKPPEKKDAPKGIQAVRDIDKQDAAAVLDALERVEPTVQKDLAHKRAANRRPTKDW